MINQKLLGALQEKGWSIEVAAARLGVGRVTFSRWVNGHQEPQPALLELLCNNFGRSADELGYGHLSKKPAQPETEDRSRHLPDIGQNLYMFADEQLAAFAALLRLGENIMFDPAKRKTLYLFSRAMQLQEERQICRPNASG